jgi:hypothetical protein
VDGSSDIIVWSRLTGGAIEARLFLGGLDEETACDADIILRPPRLGYEWLQAHDLAFF